MVFNSSSSSKIDIGVIGPTSGDYYLKMQTGGAKFFRITEAQVVVWATVSSVIYPKNLAVTSDETKLYAFLENSNKYAVIELNAATGALLRQFEM